MATSIGIGRTLHRSAALLAWAAAFGAALLPYTVTAIAQDAPPPPVCAGCDSSDARADRALAAASAAVERARQAMMDAMRQAMSANDSTGRAAEALARANGELRRAQERYERVTAQLLRRRLSAQEHRDSVIIDLRGLERLPAGYLGVTLSTGTRDVEKEGGKTLVRFDDYPTIESVDPDSPAERAGLEAGDKLLALNGKDVTTGCEPFSTLLKPGAHVLLSVKRGQYAKELTAVIVKRPESSWAQVWSGPSGAVTGSATAVRVAPSAPTAAATPAPGRRPDSSGVEIMVAPLFPSMPALPDMPTPALRFGGSLMVVAGAEVRSVGSLADYFGVRQGVLVLRVEPGTVAARSGLRDGDVIVRADGRAVSSPNGLSRAMYRASDAQLTLDIVRLKKKRTVLLKWDR